MNQGLYNYLQRYIEINAQEFELFQSYLSVKTLKRKEYLLHAGKVCKARYFINKGCLRLFYVDKKGNEQITHFGIENWWITDYDSLINRIPARVNIQAIEATELFVLDQKLLESLYLKLPKVERFFRLIMEKTYIAAQRRLEYMFSLSGEELYQVFFETNAAFFNRVPQYMIASYLGFTPEFLSKVRAKRESE